jgi:hypothetical protein
MFMRSPKMIKKKRSKLCYLCGQTNADTKDHIPPRRVFPEIPMGQLLTVPAHTSCNGKFSEDDELFRNLVIAASSRTPEGLKAWDKQVVPSWKENPGAKQQLQKRMMVFWVKDPISGTLIRQQGLGAERELYERQVDRWTRGLYYRKFHEPFPVDMKVQIEKLKPPEISIPSLNEVMIKHGVHPAWIHVEPNIFSYYYAVADENKHTTAAVFVFFNTEVFIGSTGVL